MLEDLLEETLSLSQLELLCCVYIWEPLATLGLRCQSQQEGQDVTYQLIPDTLSFEAREHVRLHPNQTPHNGISQTSSSTLKVGVLASGISCIV